MKYLSIFIRVALLALGLGYAVCSMGHQEWHFDGKGLNDKMNNFSHNTNVNWYDAIVVAVVYTKSRE